MLGTCTGSRLAAARPTRHPPDAVDCTQRVDQFLLHVIGGAQEKLFGSLVVFVNRSAVGAAQLNRVGDDAVSTVSRSRVELTA